MQGKQSRGPLSGKLRIGDNWNAITIIALSQQSPLKAVAEFVENSIDAHAANDVITRGKEKGQHYLALPMTGRAFRVMQRACRTSLCRHPHL